MNNKGFTLVELLAVIVILSLLALLATTSVTKLLQDSKKDITSIQEGQIKEAAITWSADNLDKLPSENECSYITVGDLKEYGILNSEELDDKIKIKLTSSVGKDGNLITDYEVNPKNIRRCNYAYIYNDKSGAKVDIMEGLVPVVYENNNWKVADITKKWYDYSNQEWANAVILEKGISKNIGDIVNVDREVKGMFVYVPRYEYKIEGTYGKGGTSATLPGEIEINFIEKSKITASSGYRIHPAFNFGGLLLNGIWVGKFETSASKTSDCYTSSSTANCDNTNQELYIIPNVNSLRNQNVSNQFASAQQFNTQKIGGHSHMMKNSEWGAVAYLSQSKYGKYGNSMYTGVNKEIYQNKSNVFKTGNSNGTPSTSITNTQCAYDTLIDRGNGTGSCGGGASTTGNITGIYDMSGGANEYVMGNRDNTIASSSFTTFPNEKYYDKYTTATATTACNNGICYGQALSETSGWYEDYEGFVNLNYPWFIRGGRSGSSSNAGIYNFNANSGIDSDSNSFRVVISDEVLSMIG